MTEIPRKIEAELERVRRLSDRARSRLRALEARQEELLAAKKVVEELSTGQRAPRRETLADQIARVLRGAGTPLRVKEIVAKLEEQRREMGKPGPAQGAISTAISRSVKEGRFRRTNDGRVALASNENDADDSGTATSDDPAPETPLLRRLRARRVRIERNPREDHEL